MSALSSNTTNHIVSDAVRDLLAAQLWAWVDAHADDIVLSVRVLFFSKTLRVRDLHAVFALVFGPNPNHA